MSDRRLSSLVLGGGAAVGAEVETVGGAGDSKSQFGLAQECLHHAQDFGGLLLLATASGNSDMVGKLAKGAEEKGLTNVAFLTFFLQGKSVFE